MYCISHVAASTPVLAAVRSCCRLPCLTHPHCAGVLLFHMLCGGPQFPFFSTASPLLPAEAYRHITSGDIDFTAPVWEHASPSARALVQRMLEREPERQVVAGEGGWAHATGSGCWHLEAAGELRDWTSPHSDKSRDSCYSRITVREALGTAWMREHTIT